MEDVIGLGSIKETFFHLCPYPYLGVTERNGERELLKIVYRTDWVIYEYFLGIQVDVGFSNGTKCWNEEFI